MNKPPSSHWFCNVSTGELFENSKGVGTFMLGINEALFRLIEQANASCKQAVPPHAQDCNCEICYMARESMKRAAPTVVMEAKADARFPFTQPDEDYARRVAGDPRRACDICGGFHTPPHAWEPRTEK